MTQSDVDGERGVEVGQKTEWGRPVPGPRYAAAAARAVRSAAESGALAGLGGGVSVIGGLRALARGAVGRGLVRLAIGVVLLAVAALQRAARTPVEPLGERRRGEGPAGGRRDEEDGATATSEAPTAPGSEATGAAETPAGYDRLGSAAFDEYGAEVPVPQVALNRGLLALSSEVHWGVRAADDAVVLTERYDSLVDGEEVRYVGSSELDGDRVLSVPDTVRDHWDEVAGGGTAVVSGTDIVFATDDALAEEGQVLVVPGPWVEDVLGAGAE